MTEDTMTTPIGEVPALTGRTALRIAFAGAAATAAFDLFGQAISPMLGFANLAPVPLATQTWGTLFGEGWRPGGHLLHYVAGLVAYPVGWLYLWQPLQRRVLPQVGWLLSSAVYGVALWIFALYVMLHLFNGGPAFAGFTGITWVALVGHVVFAVVAAAAARLRLEPADGRVAE